MATKHSKTTWTPPRSPETWRTEYIKITPDIAKQMLSYNNGNRPFSDALCRSLGAKMKAGDWVVTHQGIAFSESGRLIDGQHRLKAIFDSKKTIEMSVTYGLPDSAFDHIDIGGKQRTASDLLGIRRPGLKHRTLICSVANVMLRGVHGWGTRYRPDEIARYADQQTMLISQYVVEFVKGSKLTRKSPVIGAFVVAARQDDGWPGPCGRRDRDEVMLSALRLINQEWDRPGKTDPLKLLFNRLLKSDTSKGAGLTAAEQYALTVSACRADIANRKISALYVTDVDWGDKSDKGGTKVQKTRTMLRKAGGSQ